MSSQLFHTILSVLYNDLRTKLEREIYLYGKLCHNRSLTSLTGNHFCLVCSNETTLHLSCNKEFKPYHKTIPIIFPTNFYVKNDSIYVSLYRFISHMIVYHHHLNLMDQSADKLIHINCKITTFLEKYDVFPCVSCGQYAKIRFKDLYIGPDQNVHMCEQCFEKDSIRCFCRLSARTMFKSTTIYKNKLSQMLTCQCQLQVLLCLSCPKQSVFCGHFYENYECLICHKTKNILNLGTGLSICSSCVNIKVACTDCREDSFMGKLTLNQVISYYKNEFTCPDCS